MPLSTLALPPLLAFGVAMTLAAVVRLTGGAEIGKRLAGLAIPAGFLAGWAASRGFAFPPSGLADQIPYIVLGGSLIGLTLDGIGRGGRPVRIIITLLFSAICVWAALGTPTALPVKLVARIETSVAAILLLAAWLIALLQLEAYTQPTRSIEGMALFVPATLGVAVLSLISGASPLAPSAISLAASALGFSVVALATRTTLGASAHLGGGGALIGLAQCMGSQWPGTLMPLTILLLCLFAGPTARRLPGSVALRPLWAFFLALLPMALSLAVAFSVFAR